MKLLLPVDPRPLQPDNSSSFHINDNISLNMGDGFVRNKNKDRSRCHFISLAQVGQH